MEMTVRTNSMTSGNTVAAGATRALMEFAVSKGADRATLAARSGIDLPHLDNADNRVPFTKYVALMKAGQALCDDAALSLHFGESVDCSEISMMPGGMDNIEDAFAQGNRYARLTIDVDGVDGGDRFQIDRSAGQFWIVDARRNPNEFPELTESAFARMVCTSRRIAGDKPAFRAVQFTHAEPPYRSEYERIFRVPVEFDCTRNALRLDEAVLAAMRLPATSKYVTAVMKDHADGLLEKLDQSQSTRSRVETALLPLLQSGDAGMETIARTLSLSRQTLFRKLRAEGVTFEGVLSALRQRLAMHYLSTGKPVKETAHLLGFSDATAFSRAFKRWTGRAPSA
jgi:AraC-like DNA-binding protein